MNKERIIKIFISTNYECLIKDIEIYFSNNPNFNHRASIVTNNHGYIKAIVESCQVI